MGQRGYWRLANYGNDGFSWICLEDFMDHFAFSNICKYNDDDISKHAFMKPENANKESYFHLKIDQPQNLDFLVNQMGDRLHHRKRNDG